MPLSLFHVLRAVLVALVGAVVTVIVSNFDKFYDEPRQPFDDFD